jgi:hypothetical protein
VCVIVSAEQRRYYLNLILLLYAILLWNPITIVKIYILCWLSKEAFVRHYAWVAVAAAPNENVSNLMSRLMEEYQLCAVPFAAGRLQCTGDWVLFRLQLETM